MISQAKRNRIIRTRISKTVNASKKGFVSDYIRYCHVSSLVEIHEKLLDDIKWVGIMRESKEVLASKMNDDRYSDDAKRQMYNRYYWIDKDIKELLI